MSIVSRALKTMLPAAAILGVLAWFVLKLPFNHPPDLEQGSFAIEQIKLLTPEQYQNIIRDVFGDTIDIKSRIVIAKRREEGLLAVGLSSSTLSALGFEGAEDIALDVASQVIDKRHRDELIGCGPVAASEFDRDCARRFLSRTGRLLYRRALDEEETNRQLIIAKTGANKTQDFYQGIAKSLVNMLISPNFLFRVEYAEPEPAGLLDWFSNDARQLRLTGLARASRISFLLWNSAPDEQLLNAAQTGELYTAKGLQREVDRMLKSPRVQDGVRAFFSDMLELERFDTLNKDLNIYPKFTDRAAKDAREQTLRTLVDHLVIRDRDYRDLFNTRKTFLTPSLAALIGVPLVQHRANASPDRWTPYEFAEGDPRAGLIAQPSFVALHSHPGRTSPTNRGKALRENILCQEVPEPPPAVDFTLLQADANPQFKTMRERLSAHATQPACAGCHKITDPIGLALENFDAVGGYRTTENGAVIDTRGALDGVSYADAAGLGQALRDNPNVVSCVVKRVYTYGVGRHIYADERKWLKQLRQDFIGDGYRFKPLLRRIATSDKFHRGFVALQEEATQLSLNENNQQPNNEQSVGG